MMVSTGSGRPKGGSAESPAAFRTSFGERLAALLDRFGSRGAASTVARVNPDQLAKYVKGDAKPPFEVVARLAEPHNVSLDWLATGQGQPERDAPPIDDDFALIPVLQIEASSGFGSVIDHESVGEHLAFRRSWRGLARASAEGNLCIILNRGESNAPDINHADAMLVDRGVRSLSEDAYYVFDREGVLLVKMVERAISGHVILKSRNPGYSAQTLSPEEAAGLTVYGRVIWRGGLL